MSAVNAPPTAGPSGSPCAFSSSRSARVAGEACVNASGGEAAAALELGHELAEIYAQIGFD